MTAGQWEQYVDEVADRIAGDPSRVVEWKSRARAVLAVAGPRIAEDARSRLVEAAAATVEREPVVDAGRLAAWLRHEIAGAASQKETDAYGTVLRMVEKGGKPDPGALIHLRCPHCGGELYVETESTGGYYSEDRVDRIECETYECGATWDRSGVALLKPRQKCETCEVSQRTADDLGGKVPPHAKAFGGHCPGDPA